MWKIAHGAFWGQKMLFSGAATVFELGLTGLLLSLAKYFINCGFKSQKAAGCQILCFIFCFMCKLYSHLFSLLIDRRPLGSSSFILGSPSILKGFSISRFRPPHAYSSSRDWPVSRNQTACAMRHSCDCEEDLNGGSCAGVAFGPGG